MLNEINRMGCVDDAVAPFPPNPRLAMAYVPYQQNNTSIYSPEKGFDSGTMFPGLDKPFMGYGGRNNEW